MQTPTPLSRRQLLRAAACGAAAITIARFAPADSPATSPADFSFVVLGDLHLDQLEHHDMDWLRREKGNDVRQVENYSRITREHTPKLFEKVRQRVAKLPGTPFVLQLGDMVEGLCGTPALARKHCEDAVATLTDARFGAPLVFTKGNHDITGPGAVEAFDDVLWPAFKHAAMRDISGANAAIEIGDTTFLIFDCYRGNESLAWLEQTLKRNPPRGLVFFAVHQPIVPYTGRCWHVFNRAEQAPQRERLLALLASVNAIVLNGHLHRYGLMTRRVGDKTLDQFSAISVVPDADPRIVDEIYDVSGYGPAITQLEPKFSPATLEARQKTLEQERAFVTRYEHANAPGYAVVHVRGNEVRADYYTGTDDELWRSVIVRGAGA